MSAKVQAINEVQEKLKPLSDNAKELMRSDQPITTFFDNKSNDVFFGSDINKPRFQQIVEFLCTETNDVDKENVKNFFGIGNTNQNTTPMTLKQMFAIAVSFDCRLISAFDREKRGSLTVPITKPEKNTKQKITTTLNGFINKSLDQYLDILNAASMGNTYPVKDGKNPLEKSIGNMAGSIDILNGSEPLTADMYMYTILTTINRDGNSAGQVIRKCCTIIYDLVLANGFINKDTSNPLIDYGIFFNAMTSFKTMRTTQIVGLALRLNPLNQLQQGKHTISFFQEFGKDFYTEMIQNVDANNLVVEGDIEGKKITDSNLEKLEIKENIDQLKKLETFLKDEGVKTTGIGIKHTENIEDLKKKLSIATKKDKFKKGQTSAILSTGLKVVEDTTGIKNDIVIAEKTIGDDLFLLVSIHTSTDGSATVSELKAILNLFEDKTSGKSYQHLIIGMDTNCKSKKLATSLCRCCKDNNLKIAGYEEEEEETFSSKWNNNPEKWATAGGIRTFVQSQLHKANEKQNFRIDYVFYKSKPQDTDKSKPEDTDKSKPQDTNALILNKNDDSVMDQLSPVSVVNLADHRPIKYTFTLSGIEIDVLSFNTAGPNSSIFEYELTETIAAFRKQETFNVASLEGTVESKLKTFKSGGGRKRKSQKKKKSRRNKKTKKTRNNKNNMNNNNNSAKLVKKRNSRKKSKKRRRIRSYSRKN